MRRWLTRVLRPLLLLYPPEFRAAYGDEMLRLAAARCARARAHGKAAAAACVVRAAADLAWCGVLERLQGRGRPGPETPKGAGMTSFLRTHLRDATRSLRRQPGFAAAIVLTLALGSGATLALFGIVDAALLRPLPYPDAERLVSIAQRDARFGLTPFGPPFLHDLRERTGSFDVMAGFSPSWAMTLTGQGEPRIVTAAYVSDQLFDLFGVRPVRGRLFAPPEYGPGGGRVALVTQSFWERAFGADTPLAGQTIRLNGTAHEVVGILPSTFRLPIKDSAVSEGQPSAALWLPFVLNPYADLRMVPVMNVVGRLRPDVALAAARAEVESVGRTLARDFPEQPGSAEATTVPLREVVTADARPTVWPLFGAAIFLLAVACANVAGLLVARGASRRHELAIRASLGATRARLLVQLIAESVVLALAGCGAGLLLAAWLLGLVPALGIDGLPPSADIGLDGRLAAFALGLACVTSVVFGLAPALRASGEGSGDTLKSGTRVAGGSARLRRSLVAAQAALALTLLTGAGLLARSFVALTQVDPGFRAEGVLAVPIDFGGRAAPQRLAFLDQAFDGLRPLPGVTAVSAVNRTPLSGSNVLVGVEVEGDPITAREPVPLDRRVVAPGYFAAMEIPMDDGRDFTSADRPDGETRVAVVNRTAAASLWPGQRAVGRRLRLMLQSGPGPWLTVVGVSGDVRHQGLDREVRPEVYVPYAQAAVGSMTVLVRSAGDPAALTSAVKQGIWALDRNLPLDGVRPLTADVSEVVGEPRFRMLLVNAFAALALLLAAVGIYGVAAYTVSRRTRDIGVRMALGADRADIRRLVLGDGLRPVVWGAAAGLPGAIVMTRGLSGLLFDVAPFDPLTYALAAAVLAGTGFVAAYLPARRAARIDPITALRVE